MDFKKTIILTITVTNKEVWKRVLADIEIYPKGQRDELILDQQGTIMTYEVKED